jgi:NADH:ubiquinone oxidoreductase subunit K
MIPLNYYIVLACLLFSIGLAIVLVKKNVVVVLMGIELMLNASNIILVGVSQIHGPNLDGQMFALFTIVVAVAESAIVLAIILRMVRLYGTTDLNKINQIKEA